VKAAILALDDPEISVSRKMTKMPVRFHFSISQQHHVPRVWLLIIGVMSRKQE
jgi:hypothetical protein